MCESTAPSIAAAPSLNLPVGDVATNLCEFQHKRRKQVKKQSVHDCEITSNGESEENCKPYMPKEKVAMHERQAVQQRTFHHDLQMLVNLCG